MTINEISADIQCFLEIEDADEEALSKEILKKCDLKGDGSLRVVPLLAATETRSVHQVIVGTLSVVVCQGQVRLRARVAEAVNAGGTSGSTVLSEIPESDLGPGSREALSTHLKSLFTQSYLSKLSGLQSDEERVVLVAKSLAEMSNDAIRGLRAMRYDLERQLIHRSNTKSSASLSASKVVSSLTLLGIMLGKATDSVREILREGLWLHVTNSPAYHAYRKHRDSLLLRADELPDVSTITWMPKHDAAFRQCQSLEGQLRDESRAVSSILTAASTISGASEADSQRTLNYIVASASIALGLPALVFSLYGANILTDLKNFSQSEWRTIILTGAGSFCVALILALVKKLRKVNSSWWMLAVAFGLVILVLEAALFWIPQPTP